MKNDIRTKQRIPVVLPYRKPKNLNLRKVYRRHSRSLPHITSFIGTSSCKVLSDPPGSRRFICVLVEYPINTYTLWKPVQSVGIIIPKKLFQHHAFGFHMLTKENGSRLHKFVRTFRGQEAARAALRTQRFYFRMTLQVIFQAVGHVFSLGDDTHITRSIFQNLVQQQGIMRTPQNNGIYRRVFPEQVADALFHKIIGSG